MPGNYVNTYRIDINKTNFVTNYLNDFNEFLIFASNTDPLRAPPLYIPPQLSQFALVPGILHDEQYLGDGQSNVLRLIDYSDNSLLDIKASDLDKIIFRINENNEIMLSCIQDASINGKDISGMGVASMIFNIYDISNSKLLSAESDVNLVFSNTTISGDDVFTISDISASYYPVSSSNSIFPYTNSTINVNVDISINNNILSIKKSNDISDGIIADLEFKLTANNSLNLDNSNAFIHVAPSTKYDLIFNNSLFKIQLHSDFNSDDISFGRYIYLDTTTNYSEFATINPYAYKIKSINNLGSTSNIFYYNINNLSFNSNNLIILSTNEKKVGTIIKN